MFTDTHCHLASHKFAESELDDIIARAIDAGVTRLVTIGTNLADSRRNIDLAEKYDAVFATVGIHPCDVLELYERDWLEQLDAMLDHPRVVAIGEIGLDFYHPAPDGTSEDDYRAKQAEVFERQLELAVAREVNVVVHQRNSYEATVAQIAPYSGKTRAVFHCFSNALEDAATLIAQNHIVSFTGIATFKSAKEVQACAQAVPADKFMVETDAPYLAPTPHRGQRCEPAFTRNTAEHIANLREVSIESLAADTEAAANAFFRFPERR